MQSNRHLMRTLLQVLAVYFLIGGSAGAIGHVAWVAGEFVEAKDIIRTAIDAFYGMTVSLTEVAAGLYLMYSGRFFLDWLAPINRRKCIECGYDLTGNASGRCPECGSDVELPVTRPTKTIAQDAGESEMASPGESQSPRDASSPRTSSIIPAVVFGLIAVILVLGFLRKVLQNMP